MTKREIIEVLGFSKRVIELLKTHRLKQEAFDTFKSVLAENPEMGDLIQGTGGVRKTRLRSASKGTSGGFRVCYYYHQVRTGVIYLITLYPKNEQADLTPDERKELKDFVNIIKKRR